MSILWMASSVCVISWSFIVWFPWIVLPNLSYWLGWFVHDVSSMHAATKPVLPSPLLCFPKQVVFGTCTSIYWIALKTTMHEIIWSLYCSALHKLCRRIDCLANVHLKDIEVKWCISEGTNTIFHVEEYTRTITQGCADVDRFLCTSFRGTWNWNSSPWLRGTALYYNLRVPICTVRQCFGDFHKLVLTN